MAASPKSGRCGHPDGQASMLQKAQVIKREALEFRDRFNISPLEVTKRITSVFLAELLLMLRFGFMPEQILGAIDDLESSDNIARTKPPKPFTREPVRGLWHKH